MSLATLRPSAASIEKWSAVYTARRTTIQRLLTTGFIAYVLGATYLSLTSRAGNENSRQAKSRMKHGTEGNKPPRVAVSALGITLACAIEAHFSQVDAVFYQRLSRLLQIVIPGMRSREARLLVMHSSLLIFRTAISLYVAALDGKCALSPLD